MTQVLLEQTEQDRIEKLVARFDPATHPSFTQLAGEDLEVVRAYTAELIRRTLGLELLARAAGEAAVAGGWADPERAVKSFISGALEAQAHSPAYSALAAQRGGFETDDIVDRSYELLRAAETEFFGE